MMVVITIMGPVVTNAYLNEVGKFLGILRIVVLMSYQQTVRSH